MKFEIFRGQDRQFYFRIVSDNGETVATSEGYKSKQMAKKTIKALKQGVAEAEVVEK